MDILNKMYFQSGTARLRNDGLIDLSLNYIYNNGKEDKSFSLKGVVDNPVVTIENAYRGPKERTTEMLTDNRNYKLNGIVSFEFITDEGTGNLYTLEIADIQKIEGIDK